MSEVSRVQEPEPRRWPVGSPEPKEDGLRVQSTQNQVVFRRRPWNRWYAEPDSGGDGHEYLWHTLNSEHSSEGGMELVEFVPLAALAPNYATAYASLHEVVRAFLAGERNAKYLRRMHAEIEADLTGGDRRG